LQLFFQVSALVAQLFQMRARMKNLATMMQGGSIPGMEGMEDAFKGGRKVSQRISLGLLSPSGFLFNP